MADSIHVSYNLSTLHCFDEGDGLGNAEPFMWTVYFKVDGSTVKLNDSFMLEGTATVVTTPGNHGDLPDDVDAGDVVSIPSSLGKFSTTMVPIPTPLDGVTVGGMVGAIAIVMEEDSTPDDAIEEGHKALNKTLQEELDALIPTLGLSNQSPSDADIQAIEDAIKTAVEDAIADNVSFWDFLGGLFGNLQDDQIGTAKWIHSHDELDAKAGTSFNISKHWNNEGSWTLNGSVKVDKTLVAGISQGGNWGNRFLFGLTTADFIAKNQEWFDNDGLRLVHLETWLDKGNVRRWSSIHRTGDWGHRLGVGMTTADFLQKVGTFQREGYRLERMVNWQSDDSLRWAASWRTGLPTTQLVQGVDTTAFLQQTQDLFTNEGLRLVQAIRYTENGSLRWAGICQQGTWANRFYIRNDLNSFVNTVQEFFDKDGLRIVDIETWIEGGARRYAGISRSANWANRLWVHKGIETFRIEAQKAFDEDGLRLINVDVYEA